jgi:hypothetical protein
MNRLKLVVLLAAISGHGALVYTNTPWFGRGSTQDFFDVLGKINTNFTVIEFATRSSARYATNAGWASYTRYATNSGWAMWSGYSSNALVANYGYNSYRVSMDGNLNNTVTGNEITNMAVARAKSYTDSATNAVLAAAQAYAGAISASTGMATFIAITNICQYYTNVVLIEAKAYADQIAASSGLVTYASTTNISVYFTNAVLTETASKYTLKSGDTMTGSLALWTNGANEVLVLSQQWYDVEIITTNYEWMTYINVTGDGAHESTALSGVYANASATWTDLNAVLWTNVLDSNFVLYQIDGSPANWKWTWVFCHANDVGGGNPPYGIRMGSGVSAPTSWICPQGTYQYHNGAHYSGTLDTYGGDARYFSNLVESSYSYSTTQWARVSTSYYAKTGYVDSGMVSASNHAIAVADSALSYAQAGIDVATNSATIDAQGRIDAATNGAAIDARGAITAANLVSRNGDTISGSVYLATETSQLAQLSNLYTSSTVYLYGDMSRNNHALAGEYTYYGVTSALPVYCKSVSGVGNVYVWYLSNRWELFGDVLFATNGAMTGSYTKISGFIGNQLLGSAAVSNVNSGTVAYRVNTNNWALQSYAASYADAATNGATAVLNARLVAATNAVLLDAYAHDSDALITAATNGAVMDAQGRINAATNAVLTGNLSNPSINAKTGIFLNLYVDYATMTNVTIINLIVTNAMVVYTNIIAQGTLNMSGYSITNIGAPPSALSAARLTDVQACTNGAVADAKTSASRYLPTNGTVAMSGDLNLGGNYITNAKSIRFGNNGSSMGEVDMSGATMRFLNAGSYGNVRASIGQFEGLVIPGYGITGITYLVGTTPASSIRIDSPLNMTGNMISNTTMIHVGSGAVQVGQTVVTTNGAVAVWVVAGSTVSNGFVVAPSRDVDMQVVACPAGAYDPIGTCLDNVSSGTLCRIVSHGALVQVKCDKQPNLADVAFVSDVKAGYVTSTNSFSSNPTDQAHFREFGHVTSRTNATGLIWIWSHAL